MIRYLLRRLFGARNRYAGLPRLAKGWVTLEYDRDDLTHDQDLLIMTGHVTNPIQAQRILERDGATTAADVKIPFRGGIMFRERALNLYCLMMGSYRSHPCGWEFTGGAPPREDPFYDSFVHLRKEVES